MQSKLLKTLVFILILAFYASLLFYKIDFFSLSVNDLGRHIKNGEILLETRDALKTNFYSYTNPDFSFTNHHWLSGAVFYFLWKITGFGGLVIFKAAVLLSTFTLLFLASLKKSDFWLVALFSLPAILILKGRAELRPEIFSYLFTAVFIYFLLDLEKHPGKKRIFWLVPLQLLWVNLHSFFFIGILLTAGFLFEKIVLNIKNLRSNPFIIKLILLLSMIMLVCLINPNGFKGALYLLDIFKNYGYKISENEPLLAVKEIYWRDISIRIFMPMVFLLTSSFLFNIKRKPFDSAQGKPIFYFLAGAGSAAATFFIMRALPFFSLIFLPALSFNFNGIFLKIRGSFSKNWPRGAAISGKILALLLAAVFVYTGWAIHKTSTNSTAAPQELGMSLVERTNDAAIFFKERELRGPIFNDYNIGSYLIFHLFPKERVFIDNRPEAYPASFFRDVYSPALGQEEKWQEIQGQYNFNVIFFSMQNLGSGEGTFLIRRLNDPDWSLIHADAYSVIFLKNIPGNRDIIKKYQITQENISEKIGYLLESDRLIERMGAVNILIAMGREDLLIPALQEISNRWPKYSGAWLLMGKLESMKNDQQSLKSASVFIEKAVGLGEKTSESYTFLGLTYFRTGQFEKAEKALKAALKINPKRQDAKNYLLQLKNATPANW